jgi:hypothetical protein
MDLSTDPLMKQVLTDAIYEEQIRIFGDGLEYMYYVFVTDAIQGIVKALFRKETKGKVYAITSPEEISILTIVNKVLALGPNARSIKFIRNKSSIDPLYQKAYVADDNLSEIGWKPNVSFDRGIAQMFEFFKRDVSLRNFSENNNVVQVDSRAANPKNLQIAFDETVNLADTFKQSERNNNEEVSQFRNFYQKLHSADSPLYNNKNRAAGNSVRVGEPQKKRSKRHIAKYAVPAVAMLLLYLFLATPLFQVAALYMAMNSSSNNLNDFIASGFTEKYEETKLVEKARTNLVGARWIAKVLGRNDYESNVMSVAKGLDDASQASKNISKNNFNQYVLLNSKIPENSITQAQETLVLLNSARSHLEASNRVNMYMGTNTEVDKVKQWTNDMESKLSVALNYTQNLAGNKQNVLGTEDTATEE